MSNPNTRNGNKLNAQLQYARDLIDQATADPHTDTDWNALTELIATATTDSRADVSAMRLLSESRFRKPTAASTSTSPGAAQTTGPTNTSTSRGTTPGATTACLDSVAKKHVPMPKSIATNGKVVTRVNVIQVVTPPASFPFPKVVTRVNVIRVVTLLASFPFPKVASTPGENETRFFLANAPPIT